MNDDLLLVLKALHTYRQRTHKKSILLGGWVIEDPALSPPGLLVESLSHLPTNLMKYADVSWCFEAKNRAADLFSRYIRFDGQMLTSPQIAVLPSGSNGLLLTLTFLRDHGVRTLYVSSPNYFATFQAGAHLGLRVEILPPRDFLSCQLDYDRIAQALQTPNSAFILSNPAYSVGVEYTPQELDQLFAVVPEETYVVLDEVYLGLHWMNEAPWYQYDFPSRVIILRSPSKIFLLYGVKLCFLIAPIEVIQYVEMLAEFLSSVPGNFEEMVLAYIQALSTWDQEIRQHEVGEFRQWKAHTIGCFTRNLHQVVPILEEFDFRRAPINSGPYVTVATEHERLNGFDPVALAHQKGVLFMTSHHYFHEDPRWIGFRMNLCGNSQEFADILQHILPGCLKR